MSDDGVELDGDYPGCDDAAGMLRVVCEPPQVQAGCEHGVREQVQGVDCGASGGGGGQVKDGSKGIERCD